MPHLEHSRYINPYTDFGFKRIFGEEVNKEILIDFLNELLHLDSPIEDLMHQNAEQMGRSAEDRKAVFDVYCKSENGEYFIVEMQRAMQHFFIDRSIYYSTFPIQAQAKKGDWDYKLSAVYTVGILDFVFDPDDPNYYHHEVQLMDVNNHKVLTDKLNFIYLEMPKFNKDIDDCDTLLDKIMFVLKNLTRLMERPAKLQERIFTRIFEVAEIANFTPEELFTYEESLKIYRDNKNVVDYAKDEARAEGREEGIEIGREEGRVEEKINIARNLISMGLSTEQIAQATSLTIEEIENI